MIKLHRLLSLSFLTIALAVSHLSAQTFQLSRQDRERMQRETVHAIELIQSLHYRQMSFAELNPEDILRAYMEELDQTRMFFLADDIEFSLSRFAGTLKPTYLFNGDLFPAFEIFGTYAERVRARVAWVQERLQQPFDFETESTFRIDRREEAWPTDKAAADDLWQRRLKFELLGELLEDETLERAIEKISRRYDRMLRFLNEFEAHTVQELFLSSLAGLYDPHSSFFSWETAREFDIQISNSLIGIGAQLREVDGYSVLERLMPGGPAEMSGQLHPGDKIIAVAQGKSEPVDVVDMRLRRVVQMIRGPEGSEVRLTVIPANSSERRIVTLIRARVELTANLASAQIFDVPVNDHLSRTIGVIALPSFYGEGDHGENPTSTSRDVRELVLKLMERNVDGIVLDLRNNGGGRLDEAVRMTGLFIPSGPVVMRRSFNGRIDEEWDRSNEVVYSGPLAVLVSRRSASASEIVAGALQAAGRALVVGDAATHGKGTVQQPIDLRNSMRNSFFGRNQVDQRLGMVKLTVHQFYLPNGASTQLRGVESDIAFSSLNDFLRDGERDLKNALPWDEIEPVPFPFLQRTDHGLSMVSPDLLDFLRVQSSARQESLEEFQFHATAIERARVRHERRDISLNKALRQVERVEDRAFNDWARTERERLSMAKPFNSEVLELAVTQRLNRTHQEKLRETPLPNGRDRANQFYQKVFYFQESPGDEIREIWVEFFDYRNLQNHAAQIAADLQSAGFDIMTENKISTLLARFHNTDRGSTFDVEGTFLATIGEDLTDELLDAMLPHFFRSLVLADRTVLQTRPTLDIPLRESLRIIADWVAWEREETTAEAAVALVKPKTESN